MMDNILSPEFSNEREELLSSASKHERQEKDAYDTFMRRHLQHYGYYTGRNASYRENFHSLQEWRKNYDVRLSGHHDLSLVEEHFGRAGPFPSKLLDAPSVFSTDGQLPDELLHRTTQLVFQYQAGRKIPKLREPRNLYALTKEAGPQQATRWPSHMQVVCPAIRFIDYVPPSPEPLYEPTGREPTPAVRGSQLGEMLFYNDPGRDLYFMRSRVAGCRLAMHSTVLTPREYPDDHLTLEFESRFESGNLLKVDKITDFDYELTLRTDLYTNKHTQWFFFRVRNMRPEKSYRFTIINLMKPSSLYNNGMKPVWYSEINAKKNKIGWTRAGTSIRYYRNNLCSRDGKSYYSLTWTCEFPYKDDCCYFAHCVPYTYSDLQEYLLQLANDPVRSRFCKQRVLTRTLAGNLVYILTITSPSRNPELSRSKRAVVITARVHPGETNSSWMMKGFLDYLTGNSADAKLLRDTFIFKIVPMLNPDGVIVGNYRCSLAGRDLNRNYKSVLKDSFPSIWHTKMMIKRLNAERQVIVYCDLHGHSRKNNIFIYGCENKHDRSKRLQERIFPLMLSKNASDIFAFDSCKYKVQKSKEGTGRIVVWCMGIMNSYTMEATFGGTSLPGKRKNTHLSARDLEMMGYHFCDTLLDFCDPDSSKIEACMRELQDRLRRQIMKKLQMQNSNITDIDLDEFSSDVESDTSGSDSSCDDGLPVHLLAIAPKLQRKKKLRTRKDRSKVVTMKNAVSAPDTSKQLNTPNAKLPSEKVKTLRYTQSVSSGRRREDRPTASTTIVSSMLSSNNQNEKSAKKSEYLEALTSAYLRSGVLMAPEKSKDYSLRYTSGNGGGNSQEGGFAVQYLSNHLQASSAEEQYELLRQSAMRRQLSANQQRLLAQKHLVAVAAMQKRRQENQRIPSAQSCVDLPSKQPTNPTLDPRRTQTPDPLLLVTKGALQTNSRSSSTQPQSVDNSRSLLVIWTRSRHKMSGGIQKAASSMDIPTHVDRSAVQKVKGESSVREKAQTESTAQSSNAIKPSFKTEEQKPPKQTTLPESTETAVLVDTAKILPESASKTFPDSVTKSRPKHTARKVVAMASSEPKHYFTKHKPDTAIQPTSHEAAPNGSRTENGKNSCRNVELERKADNENAVEQKSHSNKRVAEQESEEKIISPNNSSILSSDNFNSLPEIDSDLSMASSHSRRISTNTSRSYYKQNIQQSPMNDIVKGEVLLPKSTDAPGVPSGIKKTTELIIETEPDKLRIQSHRAFLKNPSGDSVPDFYGQKHKKKVYQTTDDSFFGMSDRVGLGVMPRNGRVPPVVANIAELRRSLMGQGREGSENKNESPRRIISQHTSQNKILSEGFSPSEGAIPFSQRPQRRNHAAPVRAHTFADIYEGGGDRGLPVKQIIKSDEAPKEGSKSGATIITDETTYSDDNVSTTALVSERRHRSHHRKPRSDAQSSEKLSQLNGNPNQVESSVIATRSEGEHDNRIYTKGNATIEKPSEHSVTNIRIGSRVNRSLVDEQWSESQRRLDGGIVVTRTDKQSISAVSLNMRGEEERAGLTTPALASRPVPPLLRYLSAKQGQNKKKS